MYEMELYHVFIPGNCDAIMVWMHATTWRKQKMEGCPASSGGVEGQLARVRSSSGSSYFQASFPAPRHSSDGRMKCSPT